MIEKIKYLKQHLEPEKPEQSIPQSLTKPWVENLEFKAGKEKVTFEKNGIKLHLTYNEIDEERVPWILEDPTIKRIEDWRAIEELIISDKDGKEIINLNRLANSGGAKNGATMRTQTVIFPATNKTPDSVAGSFQTKGIDEEDDKPGVLLTSNIMAPCTLIALFHEIGHSSRPHLDK